MDIVFCEVLLIPFCIAFTNTPSPPTVASLPCAHLSQQWLQHWCLEGLATSVLGTFIVESTVLWELPNIFIGHLTTDKVAVAHLRATCRICLCDSLMHRIREINGTVCVSLLMSRFGLNSGLSHFLEE